MPPNYCRFRLEMISNMRDFSNSVVDEEFSGIEMAQWPDCGYISVQLSHRGHVVMSWCGRRERTKLSHRL
jgi:hypothetical protein